MKYHVLPGDSLVEEFEKTGIGGEVIVCREALIAGPIDAGDLDAFWGERARFILGEYGDDEIEYHEKVAAGLSRLTEMDADDEVALWFEYELFCSVNMWFCLWLLKDTGATLYRVEPIGLDEADRWDGFGRFGADDLMACFELRTKFSPHEVQLGASLWDAYRTGDYAAVTDLAMAGSACFPHLKEVAAAVAVQDIEPIETLKAITAGGETDFGKIFAEFKKRAGVYGYGDAQVQTLLDRLHS